MIPVIPKEEQVPILETDVMDYIASVFSGEPISRALAKELHKRLQAGAAKYGTAWNEVNLTEDLREELLDACNYVAMLMVRREHVADRSGADDVLLVMVADLLLSAFKIVSELTQCEGPTSKDWVSFDKEAQNRFQEVWNAES